jgi:hypothetical protein
MITLTPDDNISSQMIIFHPRANVIIWDKMLSSGANVIMVSSGANVIIWCYHVMLSSGMITHPFFIFPENFTHSDFFRFSMYFLTLLNLPPLRFHCVGRCCDLTHDCCDIGIGSLGYISSRTRLDSIR